MALTLDVEQANAPLDGQEGFAQIYSRLNILEKFKTATDIQLDAERTTNEIIDLIDTVSTKSADLIKGVDPITFDPKKLRVGLAFDDLNLRVLNKEFTTIQPLHGYASPQFQELTLGNANEADGSSNKGLTINMANSAILTMRGNRDTGAISQIDTFNIDTGANTVITRIVGQAVSDGTGEGEIQFYTHNGTTLAQKMVLDKDGQLGVGTITPITKFVVDGTATTSAEGLAQIVIDDDLSAATENDIANSSALIVRNVADINANAVGIMFRPQKADSSGQTSGIYGEGVGSGSAGSMRLWTRESGGTQSVKVSILDDGKVGINDLAPASKLDVDGDINTTDVYKVDDTQVVSNRITGWTDQTASASRADLGGSPTVGALASFCRALYDDLKTHGLIST